MSSLVPVCPEQLLDTKFWRTPEYQNSPEYWSTGVLEYRSTGMPEYWNTESRNPGKARFRPFGSRYTSARCSEVLIIPVLQGSEVLIIPVFQCSGVGIPWSTGEFLMLS